MELERFGAMALNSTPMPASFDRPSSPAEGQPAQPLPSQVADLLPEVLVTLESKVDFLLKQSAEADRVIQRIRLHKDRKGIIYPLEYIGFNQAYFLVNLLKCMTILDSLQDHILPRKMGQGCVLDVGCGAAPFAIAWCVMQAAHCDSFILLDKSKEQLALARSTVPLFANDRALFINGEVSGFSFEKASVVLASYFFCEQNRAENILSVLKNICYNVPEVIVVDYEDVIELICRLVVEHTNCHCLNIARRVFAPMRVRSEYGMEVVSVHGVYIRRL